MQLLGAPETILTVRYQTSGSERPEKRLLEIQRVRYRWDKPSSPCFLVTADLQGRALEPQNRLLGERVAEEVGFLQALGTLPLLDFCLLGGDFYDYPDCHKRGGTGDVSSVLNAFATKVAPTLAVLGNHDEITAASLAPTVTVLDGTQASVSGLTIGGVGGIIGNPERNQRKSEPEFSRALDRALTPRPDILLLHQGPEGPTERHRGAWAINDRLQYEDDLLVVFGHCHWPTPFHPDSTNLFCNTDGQVLVFQPVI